MKRNILQFSRLWMTYFATCYWTEIKENSPVVKYFKDFGFGHLKEIVERVIFTTEKILKRKIHV